MKMPNTYGPDSTLPTQQSYVGGRYIKKQQWRNVRVSLSRATTMSSATSRSPDRAEVDAAVAAAKAAFAGWSQTPAAERGAILRRAAKLLRERNLELAELETLDTGKPVAETTAVDIITGVEVIEYYAGVAQTLSGQYVDLPPEAFAMLRREPLGVCAGIGAWNYPIQIAMWKSGPALACGNTMVFKPAEQTPLSALKLAEIFTEAGLAAGRVQCRARRGRDRLRTGESCRCRQSYPDRLRRDRQESSWRRLHAKPEESHARAGRKIADRHL